MKILLSFVGNTDPWFFKGAPEEMTPECPLGRDNEGAASGAKMAKPNDIVMAVTSEKCRKNSNIAFKTLS